MLRHQQDGPRTREIPCHGQFPQVVAGVGFERPPLPPRAAAGVARAFAPGRSVTTYGATASLTVGTARFKPDKQWFASLIQGKRRPGEFTSYAVSRGEPDLVFANDIGDKSLPRLDLSDLGRSYFGQLICGDVRRNPTRAEWAQLPPNS